MEIKIERKKHDEDRPPVLVVLLEWKLKDKIIQKWYSWSNFNSTYILQSLQILEGWYIISNHVVEVFIKQKHVL